MAIRCTTDQSRINRVKIGEISPKICKTIDAIKIWLGLRWVMTGNNGSGGSDLRDLSPEARLCHSYVAKSAGTSDRAQSKITVIPLR
jgi:ABC-type molybdenum transport system ATPase subunit/photorepair protein PhrA